MMSVIQVTNVSPSATNEQVQTLFTFLGPIESMALYPLKQDPANPITKVAFVKFSDPGSVNPAQHLTNTVFIDRALICTCYDEGIIPDENVAMQFSGPANVPKNGLQLSHVPNVDPAKLDEIQRTVYVGNIDSKNATAENLMDFFSAAGDVRFVRMAGDETQPTRFAFVEFATVKDVKAAIRMSGQVFAGRLIKINHSNNAIVKPPGMKPDSQEVSEAMRKVREAQSLISKALDPEKAKEKEESTGKKKRSRSRSRSRSRRRRRSRSRDRSSRRRSRSRDRSRSSRRRRTRSRSRERSSRHRSRSSRRSRSRSRDRRRSKRSRSRSRDKRRSGSRDRKRSRRRSRSRSKKRDSKKRDRREDSKERKERKRKSKDRKSDEDEESDRKEKKISEQEIGGDADKEDKKKGDVSSSEDEKNENGVAENGDHR